MAAFEKSLANMTCRLQSLTMTAEQKVRKSIREHTNTFAIGCEFVVLLSHLKILGIHFLDGIQKCLFIT